MPRRRSSWFLAVSFVVASGSAATLQAQFPWAGARAVGMGGAQVAAVNDATAAWSNPAALAGLSGWNIQLFGSGLGANRNNLIGAVDNLASLPFDEIADGERLDLLPELLGDLERLFRDDTAVIFAGVGGLVVSKNGFALSVGDVPYAGVYPVIDLVHVVPNGGPGNGLLFNESGLYFAGLSAREVRLAYGRGFLGDVVRVGGAARLVFGRTYFARCGVFDECDEEDLTDIVKSAFDENALNSTEFAFDLAAQLNLGIVRLGVTGVSLNEPDFDVAAVPGSPLTVPLPRQVRGGVAVDILSFATLTADGDFIKSETLAPGTESQQMSIGAEFRIPMFAFRAGAFQDFAATDKHWGYTLGIGFGVPLISVDVAIALSPRGGLDPNDIDREDLGAGANVKLRF